MPLPSDADQPSGRTGSGSFQKTGTVTIATQGKRPSRDSWDHSAQTRQRRQGVETDGGQEVSGRPAFEAFRPTDSSIRNLLFRANGWVMPQVPPKETVSGRSEQGNSSGYGATGSTGGQPNPDMDIDPCGATHRLCHVVTRSVPRDSSREAVSPTWPSQTEDPPRDDTQWDDKIDVLLDCMAASHAEQAGTKSQQRTYQKVYKTSNDAVMTLDQLWVQAREELDAQNEEAGEYRDPSTPSSDTLASAVDEIIENELKEELKLLSPGGKRMLKDVALSGYGSEEGVTLRALMRGSGRAPRAHDDASGTSES